MAHRSRGMLNPFSFAMMGMAAGALQFNLNENIQRMAEEADMRKEQRLAELKQRIDISAEGRANSEYDRRAGVDSGYRTAEADHAAEIARTNDDHRTTNDIRVQTVAGNQTLTREQQMEAQRADDARKQAEHEAQLARGTHAYERTFDAVAAEKDPNYFASKSNDQKGVLGSDGKTYKFGEPLPQGVTAQGGYGVSWAPSASKSRPGSLRPGARPGLAPTPGAGPAPSPMATMPHPQSPQEYAQLPSGTSYIAPDGTIRVKP